MGGTRGWAGLLAVATAAFALVLSSHLASAERVLIAGAGGQQGQGWLFGSTGRTAGECWITTPRHVVADPLTGELRPFVFYDASGHGGESLQPVTFDEVLGMPGVDYGFNDLAFAQVAFGRAKGQCMSRLGLPTYVYEQVLRSGPELRLFSMLPTSFGLFQMVVARARTDSFGGALLELRPLRPEDGDYYLKQGLSGATAEVEWSGELQPFAMIVEVRPEEGVARAMRFDLLKMSFEAVEIAEARKRRSKRAAVEGVPYSVLGFEGIALEANVSLSDLQFGSSCWRVAPHGGKASISVLIELADPHDRISGLGLVAGKDCQPEILDFQVHARTAMAASWSYIRPCRTAMRTDEDRCDLDLAGPRQIRVTLPVRGPLGVLELRLR